MKVSLVLLIFALAALFVVNKGEEANLAENAFEKRYYGTSENGDFCGYNFECYTNYCLNKKCAKKTSGMACFPNKDTCESNKCFEGKCT